MMNLKAIFKGLSKLFDWLLNINIVLGIAAIIFVSVNAFTHKNSITANYLGEFKAKTEQIGQIDSKMGSKGIYINEIVGTPSVLINSKANLFFTYSFIAFILSIVLGFNYQLMKLFKELTITINEGSPFGYGIAKRFSIIAKLSLLFFIIGIVISSLKLILITQIEYQGLIFKPVFDSQILNLAWISIGFFIIAGIFKIGFQIQQENDLTI